jgi:hypothetical protein
VLFQSEDITRARSAFNLLNTLGVWLPVIVLILLVLGVYVAKDHRRALVGAGLGVALAMLALALGLAVFRSVYLNGVPAEVLPHDAAAVLYDTVVRFLRAGLRTILVVGLVVAAGAFLTGQSVTAVRARQSLAGGIGWLRGGAERAGLRTGPVGTWVGAHKRALRIAAVALASLALVFWSRPTGKVVIGLALALLVALAIIEFLGRPTERTAEVSTTPRRRGQRSAGGRGSSSPSGSGAKLTSMICSGRRSSVSASATSTRRSGSVSGGCSRLRGHNLRASTTLISAA